MTAVLTNSGQLAARRVRAFLRQPWFIAVTLVQPLIWLLLFGQLFKAPDRHAGLPRRCPTSRSSRPASS